MSGTAHPLGFSVASLALRAAAIGALAYGTMQLVLGTRLYATAAVLIVLAVLIGVSMAQSLSALKMRFEAGVATLARESLDRAPTPGAAAEVLRLARLSAARELEQAHALLDTVPAALIVVGDGGRVSYLNRAARVLARDNVAHICQIAPLAPAVSGLLAMRPGAGEVLPLADGSAVYVSCTRYSIHGVAEQRLYALQRIAGDLDAVEAKAWSDMARVLAHEVMNSLTPIASLSESLEQLLTSASDRTELATALEVIKRRSLGLMNFVERYRAVAELPAPKPQPLAMRPFLEGLEKLMSVAFRERCIRYSCRVAPADLVVHADAELLEQALINLLQNAAEAVDGAPTAEVSIECTSSDEGISITVADSGRGLPPELARGDAVAFFSNKRGGGVGLTVARHVALAHGGRLTARANTPAGAAFSLTLPAT